MQLAAWPGYLTESHKVPKLDGNGVSVCAPPEPVAAEQALGFADKPAWLVSKLLQVDGCQAEGSV